MPSPIASRYPGVPGGPPADAPPQSALASPPFSRRDRETHGHPGGGQDGSRRRALTANTLRSAATPPKGSRRLSAIAQTVRCQPHTVAGGLMRRLWLRAERPPRPEHLLLDVIGPVVQLDAAAPGRGR